MSLNTGNYHAAPVSKDGLAFELEINNAGMTSIDAVRKLPSAAPETAKDELDALKESVADIKKAGWGGMKKLMKKAVESAVSEISDAVDEAAGKQKAEPQAAAAPNMLDPVHAYAYPEEEGFAYQAISSTTDKEKNTDSYQFRSKRLYGVLTPVGNGVFQEISFCYANDEYMDKFHAVENIIGASVQDWRREDPKLHKMRVHYISQNKNDAEQYAKEANLEAILNDYFAIDFNSSRDKQAPRINFPDIELDPRSGALTLDRLHAWYLPIKTKGGREIQYGWDALRVSLYKGEELIRRQIVMCVNKGRYYINTTHNQFDVMDGGYFAEIDAGDYELRVSIYDEVIANYAFQVECVTSSDSQSEPPEYLVARLPIDDYIQIEQRDPLSLHCHYSMKHLLPQYASAEEFSISAYITKDGKYFPEWDKDRSYLNDADTIDIRNKPKWSQDRQIFSFAFVDRPSSRDQLTAEDGDYCVNIEVNGEVVGQAEFSVKDAKLLPGKLLSEAFIPSEFAYPQAENGHFYPLKK